MSNRKLSPGDIIIYKEYLKDLIPVQWKPGVSLGRRGSDYYEYLIVDDMEKAKKLIPFDFRYEKDIWRTVINVDRNKTEMKRHAKEMGLEVMYIGMFWRTLVISKPLLTETHSCEPPETSSYEFPSCEPPPYESSSCEPPPYNSGIDPNKHQDGKPDIKEK